MAGTEERTGFLPVLTGRHEVRFPNVEVEVIEDDYSMGTGSAG